MWPVITLLILMFNPVIATQYPLLTQPEVYKLQYRKLLTKRFQVPHEMLNSSDPDPENSDSDSDWYNRYYASAKDKTVPFLKQLAKDTKYKFGTTRHIKEIFLGRCYEYQYKKGIIEENEWNCESLWNTFFKAFAYKNPCDVVSSDYKKLVDMIDEDIPRDKGLLWSGTRELAHKYSDFLYSKRFTTLEDTLAGFLVNGLSWCGSKNSPGINLDECPWQCSIQTPYWSMINQRFAQKLRGIVHIVLNGTRQHLIDRKIYPSYMKNRYYLGPFIIPEFKKENINRVIILVAHTLDLKPLESCGEKTILSLTEDIKRKEIPVECYDDSDIVKHILCTDNPLSKRCLAPYNKLKKHV